MEDVGGRETGSSPQGMSLTSTVQNRTRTSRAGPKHTSCRQHEQYYSTMSPRWVRHVHVLWTQQPRRLSRCAAGPHCSAAHPLGGLPASDSRSARQPSPSGKPAPHGAQRVRSCAAASGAPRPVDAASGAVATRADGPATPRCRMGAAAQAAPAQPWNRFLAATGCAALVAHPSQACPSRISGVAKQRPACAEF